MSNVIPFTTPLTMTSREIAELVEKRHDNVLRDIDNLLKKLASDLMAGFSMTYEGDPSHGFRVFHLDRDSSYCVVAGYDANARMRIIKRWQELESGAALPKATDPIIGALVHGLMEIDAIKQQNARLIQHQASLDRKTEILENRVQNVELQHRHGVPSGYLSKKNAHHLYGEGLSEDIFHLALAKAEVTIKNYISRGEDGYESATFAYLESEIQAAVDLLIEDAVQCSVQMCQSPMLGGKRFRYVKEAFKNKEDAA